MCMLSETVNFQTTWGYVVNLNLYVRTSDGLRIMWKKNMLEASNYCKLSLCGRMSGNLSITSLVGEKDRRESKGVGRGNRKVSVDMLILYASPICSSCHGMLVKCCWCLYCIRTEMSSDC